ncbi:putative MFS family arabinose efflux permease [Arthrobacter bambusae]|uniref:MFS family arabinose efflux permease n=1 Tax=Arthrobacter bambusae TaxID=1338426 RepID=A0ABV2P0Y4_9MICC
MMRANRYSEFKTGWPALLSATIGSAVGVTALLFYSLGSFTGALQMEFGWNRAEVSSAFLYTTIALVIFAAPLGWLLDRFGPRRVAMISVPGLTLSLILLGQFRGELVHFYLLFALAGLLGLGTTSIVYTKAVNSAFFTSRGLALGITLGGLGVAALALPPLVTGVVQSLGWRTGFTALAVLSLLVIPFVLFGLKVSGHRAESSRELAGMNRADAVKSRTFWTILAGFLLVGGSVPAVIPHMVPMLTDSGLAPASAAGIASLIGLGVIVGRLGIGFLVDRFFAPYVAAPLFLTTALGCLLLMWGGPGLAPVAAIMIGVSFGAEADLIAFLCGNYFGLRRYGFIYGLIYAAFSIAVAVGPIWAGSFFDRTGSYDGALITVAVMLTIGSLVLLTLPKVQPFASTAPTAKPVTQADDLAV